MITAPPGLVVLEAEKGSRGNTYFIDRPVLAFDEEGRPLVMGLQGLELPSMRHGSYQLDGCPVEYVPAQPGWYVRLVNTDEPEMVWRSPVLSWGVPRGDREWAEGDVVILGQGDNGNEVPISVSKETISVNVEVVGIYHDTFKPEDSDETYSLVQRLVTDANNKAPDRV